METPIPIINNTHVELTRIVKFKGEYYENKISMFLADIVRLEVSRRHDTGKICTKIVTEDEYFKVVEHYKKLNPTWLAYLEWCKIQ